MKWMNELKSRRDVSVELLIVLEQTAVPLCLPLHLTSLPPKMKSCLNSKSLTMQPWRRQLRTANPCSCLPCTERHLSMRMSRLNCLQRLRQAARTWTRTWPGTRMRPRASSGWRGNEPPHRVTPAEAATGNNTVHSPPNHSHHPTNRSLSDFSPFLIKFYEIHVYQTERSLPINFLPSFCIS